MAAFQSSVEQRGQDLTPLDARAIFNNGQSNIECHVRNFSITGARLALSGSVNLPDEFLLEVPSRQKTYRAGLRWKSRDAAGVRFLSEISVEHELVRATENATFEKMQLEIERLRRENRELSNWLSELGLPACRN